jgi:hypothetical protein
MNPNESAVEWTGFYQEGPRRVPFSIQHMKILTSGKFKGHGVNSSGNYTISGRILINGRF